MQPQFHRQRLAALTDLMVSAMSEAFDTWELSATGAPFNLAPAFNHLTMRVITRTLFGTGLTAQEMDEVAEALTYAVDYVLKAMVLNALPAWLPVPGRKQYQQATAQIDWSVYRIIASRALSWAFDYLVRRPEMMQKLQAEVDAAPGNRRPTFADLPKLPYARMVLQETLRLRPQPGR